MLPVLDWGPIRVAQTEAIASFLYAQFTPSVCACARVRAAHSSGKRRPFRMLGSQSEALDATRRAGLRASDVTDVTDVAGTNPKQPNHAPDAMQRAGLRPS